MTKESVTKNDVSKDKKAKPFLKWAGGKSRIADNLKDLMPPKGFKRYYEPFLGSGALYFRVSPRNGRLNDLNINLIGAYNTLRDKPEELIGELAQLERRYHEVDALASKKEMYLSMRDEYNSQTGSGEGVRRAAIFIFLNKAGFNGMYRENAKGGFNIPFGQHLKPRICDPENLRKVSGDLGAIELTSLSYMDAVSDAAKGDFVYLDPPYYPISGTSKFTEYQAGGFSIAEQEILKDVFDDLNARGCYVMLSNSYCKEVGELYRDYHHHTVEVGRTINSKRGERGKVREYVITNY